MIKLPSGWRIESLGNCCQIVSGSTPSRSKPEYWDGNISWVTPKDLSNLKSPILEDTPEKITEAGYKSCSTTLMPTGTILFSSRAPIGYVAIAGKPMCSNQGFKNLVPSSSVHSAYLYWCMRNFARNIAALGTGTTFKEVSKGIIEKFQIPLPPLEEQRRIAAILDKADAVRRKRQSAIALTEELLRSAFLEMFGDPDTNPKGWEIKTIEQICNVTKLAGFEYTKHIKYQNSGEIIALRALNVKNGRLKLNLIKFIDRETSNFLKRSKLFKGDVVMTYIGVNIGDVAIIDKDNRYHLAPNVAKISPKSNVNSVYLMRCLEFSKNQLEKYTTNTAKQALNMGKIREITIPLPSLALQDKFASCIEQIQKSAVKHQNSLIESQIFFNALIQKAFRGQL